MLKLKVAERSRLSLRLVPMGPVGMNPTSIAGSPIPSLGARNANSMRSNEASPCADRGPPTTRRLSQTVRLAPRSEVRLLILFEAVRVELKCSAVLGDRPYSVLGNAIWYLCFNLKRHLDFRANEPGQV